MFTHMFLNVQGMVLRMYVWIVKNEMHHNHELENSQLHLTLVNNISQRDTFVAWMVDVEQMMTLLYNSENLGLSIRQ
jgi:hypothetical protein